MRESRCPGIHQLVDGRGLSGVGCVLACNLRTVRAYLLEDEFHLFWEYISPAWAEKFMDQWCIKALRSRLEPMRKIARMLRGGTE